MWIAFGIVAFVAVPIAFGFVLEAMRHRYEKKWRGGEPPTHQPRREGDNT